jgi:signal transduction histidine kinase/ActR/RegA family two-component response regulator
VSDAEATSSASGSAGSGSSNQSVQNLLVRSARNVTRLLAIMVPILVAISVANDEAELAPSLTYLAVLETGFVGLWLLARGKAGERWPEQILFCATLLAAGGVIFSPAHLLLGYKAYAMLAPMVAQTFASLAPVRPWLTFALAGATAALYALSLWLVPAERAVDPLSYAFMCLAMACLGASFARDQLRLWADLDETRARALEATRLKSEFLTNMSHEIRTPMTAILGFAEEVEVELGISPANAKIRAALSTVRRNGAHLLSLINGILDLSKIEAGRLEIARERVSPVRVVAEVASLLGVHAVEKGLVLETVAIGDVPEAIETDRTRLRQILINLVGNAVKFTDSGRVRIEVGLVESAPEPARWLEIAVVDTGCGIAPAQMQRVFESFTQVQGSLTRAHQGTGLGLALSRKLARLLGGEIQVESVLGHGSRFGLRIPCPPLAGVRVLSAAEVGEFAVLERPSVAARSIELAGRVLLVEDGLDNQRLIGGILRRAGLSVEIAPDGAQGCELALLSERSDEPYDVVLMDMQMPVLDGYTAVQRLRASGYGGAIIALTAHAMAGDRERCLAVGCSDYATKPIAREELLAQVASHLPKASSG